MNLEMIEKIKKLQNENSNVLISEEELMLRLNRTERNLGRELSGYATLDEPYNQFYAKDVIGREYPKIKISDYVMEAAQKWPSRIAYHYYNRDITFEELATNMLVSANILKGLGIQEKDIVVFSAPSTPEAIYLFFGLAVIGAVSRPIDPISSPNVVKANLLETSAKLFVTLDLNYHKYKDVIDELENVRVIPLSLSNSLPLGILPFGKDYENIENIFVNGASCFTKILMHKEKIQHDKWMNWNNLVHEYSCKLSDYNYLSSDYQENDVISILSTSGSTGKSKGVCLTNENFVASIEKQKDANYALQRNWKIFNPMPTCSSYFWDDILLAISLGMSTRLYPLFNALKAPRLIMKARCEINLAGPLIFEKWNDYLDYLDARGKFISLHWLKIFISGGDVLSLNLERRTNETQKKHGSPAVVANALGTSEQVGPSLSPNGVLSNPDAYQEGSVGISLPGNSMAIFAYDEENGCRNMSDKGYDMGLLYYEIGEICYKRSNENVFLEYYHNLDTTNETILTHNDGTVWYHTGDLGYMDVEGRIFCSGRRSGLIVSDGHKVWGPKIENIVKNIEGIQDCSVIGVSDEKKKEVPVLFVAFENKLTESNKSVILEDINNQILLNLDEYHVPSLCIELSNIPRNLMLKANIKELNKQYQEYLKNYVDKSNSKKKLRVRL